MSIPKPVLFPHHNKWYTEYHDAKSFISFERDHHFPFSVEQLVLSCWIDQWDAVDLNFLGNISLAVWCLLNSDLPEGVQFNKAKTLLHRGEIHVAVGILIRLGLVKEAVKIYMEEGYLFDAQLLNELKLSKSDETWETSMAHLERNILSTNPQTHATHQQHVKPSLCLNTNILMTEKSRTLTPIIKNHKTPWDLTVLETIEED